MFKLRQIPEEENQASTEIAEEVVLESPAETALQTGLHELPAPTTSVYFDALVLSVLREGRDFDPWWQQALKRLRWMALPVIFGFSVAYIGIFWFQPTLPRMWPELPLNYAARQALASSAPSLPPMPKQISPSLRSLQQAEAKKKALQKPTAPSQPPYMTLY